MQTAIAPQAHTVQQPGLRGHSWDASTDLLKRYLIERSIPGGGWSGVASAHTEAEASREVREWVMDDELGREFRVRDQFKRR